MNSLLRPTAGLYMLIFLFMSCSKDEGYQKSPNGLQYKVIEDNKLPKAKPGEYIAYHVTWRTMDDSVLFSSEEVNQPLISLVARPLYEGDLWEIFSFVSDGDSASCKVPAKNIFKAHLPANLKPTDMMKVDFKVIAVMTAQEYDSVKFAMANEQLIKEDQSLQNYMKERNWVGNKTPSGLYVVVDQEGTGTQVATGKETTVKYAGRLLDETEFDSGEYTLTIGNREVIAGWEEGLTHFKKGGKGKLLIPSKLGYGERGYPPKIGPNQALVFDVEIIEVN